MGRSLFGNSARINSPETIVLQPHCPHLRPYKLSVANAALSFTRAFPPSLSSSFFPGASSPSHFTTFPDSHLRNFTMLSSRTGLSTQSQFSKFSTNHPLPVFFFGLNAIRVIGIISLVLVLASSILVMVTDVAAVNAFLEDAKSSGTPVDQLLEGCDYIEYASSSPTHLLFLTVTPNTGTAPSRTKREESFGPSSIDC